jgi:hypothetical protein
MKNKPGPGRPRLPNSEKRVHHGFRLRASVLASLKRRAKAKNLSTGKFVEQLIES